MLLWFLMGLVTITAIGLVASVALSAWPSWLRWTLGLGTLAAVWVFADLLVLLLMVATFVVTFSLPAWIALRDRPSGVKWTVALGAISLVVVPLQLTVSRYLAGSVGWVLPQESRSDPLRLLALLLLLLVSAAGVIWIAHPSTEWRVRRSYGYAVLLWIALSFFPAWYFFGMATFERAISSVLSGAIDPGAVDLVRWEMPSGRDASWLRDLPAVSDVDCVTYSVLPHGACCRVDFQDGRGSEVHIFQAGFRRYAVRKFTIPSFGMCRNPGFDPRAAPEDSDSQEFVPCDQLRRTNNRSSLG
jgi:hypothetical protein